ncbi:divergent polysaccharide deacetylase family protein [Paenibacillus sp. PAMC 26794]|uniref:divergent polysaccharide deacetylase family protein n=1 Tax=Paenibacillus sp. PAMC 26794 TaxID=1257080 RepID=UPI0002E56308|nr:divergent polysaccharide deacetylase family protein [Paenibacillus sp. PAMC 26794]
MIRKKMGRSYVLGSGCRWLIIFCVVNMFSVGTAATAFAEPAASESTSANHKRLAIIIDDVGNDMKGTAEILAMPVKLTVAVMPFLPTTKKDAIAAHEKGMDVIVHMPMEPKKGRPEWLGPGAITSNLTDEEVRSRVEKAIDDVPHAIGMNNHMGSKITSDKRIMSIVLDVCKERGLFFVDSRTNFRTVVGELAISKNMPPVGNDIFLDDQNSKQHIRKQLDLAAQRAIDKDICVVIGHVGHSGMNTSAVIRESVSRLQNQVQFVGIGDLVRDVWNWRAAPTLPTDNK